MLLGSNNETVIDGVAGCVLARDGFGLGLLFSRRHRTADHHKFLVLIRVDVDGARIDLLSAMIADLTSTVSIPPRTADVLSFVS